MEKTAQDKKNLWFYPLGTVGRDMVYALISNFLLTFILFTRNLNAAQLTAVTAIMVFARVFDALNDPIMGNIIECTRTKMGKFKPWLLIGCVLTGFVIYFTFNSKLEGWAFIALFGAMYIAYSITYTMSDISYWGMVPALSSDADMRNQLTSRATLFAGIGGTSLGIFLPMLTAGDMTIGGDARTAYGVIALVIAIITPLFSLFTFFGVKEKRDANEEPKAKVSFKKIIDTVKGNDQLRWIAVIFLIQEIGNGLILGGLGSSYIYFTFGYDGGKYSLFTTVGMAATAFLMVFYPMISRKINRKPFMGMMMVVSAVGYALMLISGLFLPGEIRYWGLVIGFMAGNFGNYSFYLMMMISILNTVEYNELKHGTRDEGIIASVRPFMTKFASAITVLMTSVIYLIFGVTNITNKIADYEKLANQKLIEESEKIAGIQTVLTEVRPYQSIGLLLCITILPAAFMYASYVLYKKKYTLDEAEYDQICAELEKKETNK